MLNDYILLSGIGIIIITIVVFSIRLYKFAKAFYLYDPCERGCQYAKDCGMNENSCVKRCQYTNQKVK